MYWNKVPLVRLPLIKFKNLFLKWKCTYFWDTGKQQMYDHIKIVKSTVKSHFSEPREFWNSGSGQRIYPEEFFIQWFRNFWDQK